MKVLTSLSKVMFSTTNYEFLNLSSLSLIPDWSIFYPKLYPIIMIGFYMYFLKYFCVKLMFLILIVGKQYKRVYIIIPLFTLTLILSCCPTGPLITNYKSQVFSRSKQHAGSNLVLDALYQAVCFPRTKGLRIVILFYTQHILVPPELQRLRFMMIVDGFLLSLPSLDLWSLIRWSIIAWTPSNAVLRPY